MSSHETHHAYWYCFNRPRGSGSCLPGHYTYTSHEKIIDIGPIQATRETKKTIPLSPFWGGIARAGGIVLVIIGAKNKP